MLSPRRPPKPSQVRPVLFPKTRLQTLEPTNTSSSWIDIAHPEKSSHTCNTKHVSGSKTSSTVVPRWVLPLQIKYLYVLVQVVHRDQNKVLIFCSRKRFRLTRSGTQESCFAMPLMQWGQKEECWYSVLVVTVTCCFRRCCELRVQQQGVAASPIQWHHYSNRSQVPRTRRLVGDNNAHDRT